MKALDRRIITPAWWEALQSNQRSDCGMKARCKPGAKQEIRWSSVVLPWYILGASLVHPLYTLCTRVASRSRLRRLFCVLGYY